MTDWITSPYWEEVVTGVGIKASMDLEEKLPLLPYNGQVYRDIWTDADLPEPVQGFPIQIGPGIVQDGMGGIRLINHSCDPTCGVRLIMVEVAGVVSVVTWIYTRRNVKRGELLTFDYGTSQRRNDFVFPKPDIVCACGSARCRGVRLGYESMPQSIRDEYLAQGMILPHLTDAECADLEARRICPAPEHWQAITRRWLGK